MIIDRVIIEIHEQLADDHVRFLWNIEADEMWDFGEAETYEDALHAASMSLRLRPNPGELV